MSPLASIRGTGGSINDTAVKQNQNTLTHPKDHTKGEYTVITAGTGSWTVPPGVTKICIVVVAGGGGGADAQAYKGTGGGGGGGLSWGNNITVKPGDSLEYNVGEGGEGKYNEADDGGDTWIKDAEGSLLLQAEGGRGGSAPSQGFGGWGGFTAGPYGSGVDGGARGGNGSGPHTIDAPAFNRTFGGGGGGAGGYSGEGGNGGYKYGSWPYTVSAAEDGSGGGGGGGLSGYSGGGVGLYGEGNSGEAGPSTGFPAGGEGGSPAATNTESAKSANEPGAGPELSDDDGGGEDGLSHGVTANSRFGGGGASGGNFFPPDPGEGRDGADGGLRICWGCGVSFPHNADGHYPTPS